jgi:hypothetical protein
MALCLLSLALLGASGAGLVHYLRWRSAPRGPDLSGRDLRTAWLAGLDLRGARLVGADLTRANVMRADLRGADLSGAVLYHANLAHALYDRTTRWGRRLRRVDRLACRVQSRGSGSAAKKAPVGNPRVPPLQWFRATSAREIGPGCW